MTNSKPMLLVIVCGSSCSELPRRCRSANFTIRGLTTSGSLRRPALVVPAVPSGQALSEAAATPVFLH